MIPQLPDDTMIVTLRVADLREIVRAAVAEALAANGQHDLLDLKQAAERYRIGRDSILAAAKRGEIALAQGPRRKFLVRADEVERWLTHRKYVPPERTVTADLAEWDRQAEVALQKASGQATLFQAQKLVKSYSARIPANSRERCRRHFIPLTLARQES